MTIQEIKIKKLYGFMDKDIVFNNKISILVGINGSGKTSVLNIINWLLKPDIEELCLIEFESIVLTFKHNGDNYVLTGRQNNVEITLNLENKTIGKKYNQIQATFKTHPKVLTKNEHLKRSLLGKYDELRPDDNEKETWTLLYNEIPKPIVIGLDRNLYSEEKEDYHFRSEILLDEARRLRRKENELKSSPLENVKSLLHKEHNIYRNKVLRLYSSLNEKIMLSAFDDIFTKGNITQLLKSPRPSSERIDTLKEQVVAFLEENQAIKNNSSNKRNIKDSIEKVNNYFDKLQTLLKTTQDNSDTDELLYITNINQFKKINSLILEFKEFEDTTNKLYFPLKEFLQILNKFFLDSAKELYFDKESSDVKFNILNKKGDKIDGGRDIINLSSGERQILILLTYIKFNSNLDLFIIDEPELSLHPKWQGEFLDAAGILMPHGSQIIIATHSPEIIGNKGDYCKVLLPYNS